VIGIRSPAEAKDFSSSFCVQTGSGAHPVSCTTGTGGSFPGAKRGRGVTLTTNPHLVPRSRMSRSYISSHPKRHHGVYRDCFAFTTLPNIDARRPGRPPCSPRPEDALVYIIPQLLHLSCSIFHHQHFVYQSFVFSKDSTLNENNTKAKLIVKPTLKRGLKQVRSGTGAQTFSSG
jgi:hypothetical protein